MNIIPQSLRAFFKDIQTVGLVQAFKNRFSVETKETTGLKPHTQVKPDVKETSVFSRTSATAAREGGPTAANPTPSPATSAALNSADVEKAAEHLRNQLANADTLKDAVSILESTAQNPVGRAALEQFAKGDEKDPLSLRQTLQHIAQRQFNKTVEQYHQAYATAFSDIKKKYSLDDEKAWRNILSSGDRTTASVGKAQKDQAQASRSLQQWGQDLAEAIQSSTLPDSVKGSLKGAADNAANLLNNQSREVTAPTTEEMAAARARLSQGTAQEATSRQDLRKSAPARIETVPEEPRPAPLTRNDIIKEIAAKGGSDYSAQYRNGNGPLPEITIFNFGPAGNADTLRELNALVQAFNARQNNPGQPPV